MSIQNIREYALTNRLRFHEIWNGPFDDDNYSYSAQCGNFKVSQFCKQNEKETTMRFVCERLWNHITKKKRDINQMRVEWLFWGKKNIIPKYPDAKLNDITFFQNPPPSLIVGFESNHGEKPFMAIFMNPFTKQIYVFAFQSHENNITNILQNPNIHKAFFHRSYIEILLGVSIEKGRELKADIENHWNHYYPNFSEFLPDLYKQNFSFAKQQYRYVEGDADNWSPNIIMTGMLQVIALYEFLMTKKRSLKKTKAK